MADSPDPSGIPEARAGDDDDVSWALQTAAVQLKRGTMADALPWLRRAVDAANAAGDAFRATELAEAVTRLEAEVVPIDAEVEVAVDSLPPPSEEPAPLSEEAFELEPESIPPSRPATATEVAVPPPAAAPAAARPPPPSALRPGPPRPSTGPPRPSSGPPRPPSAPRPPASTRAPVAAAPAPQPAAPIAEAPSATAAEAPPPTLATPPTPVAPLARPASPAVPASAVGALIAEAMQAAGPTAALDDDLASLPPALRPPTPLPPPDVRARLRASLAELPAVGVPTSARREPPAPESDRIPAMSEPPPSVQPLRSAPPPSTPPPSTPPPTPPSPEAAAPLAASRVAAPPAAPSGPPPSAAAPSLAAPSSAGPPPSLADELAAELAAEFDALDGPPASDEQPTAALPVEGEPSEPIYEPPPPPPPEPEPEPDEPGFIGGLALAEIPGLEDLPEEAHAELSATAAVHRLEANEELGGFGVALVLAGNVAIMPSVADLPCARAARGEVIFTSGNLAEGVALRVVATMNRTRVATWDSAALVHATSECPWVADDLRAVADRFQALAGATMGAFGERMDETLFRQVVDRCAVRRLLPGEVLFAAGHEVDALVVVGAGRLELLDGEAVEDELGPGDLVYSSQLMAHGKAPRTVRAGAGGVLLLHADRKAAHELMVSVPPLLEILVG